MLDQIWTFLEDEGNRNVIAWIGGGLVVVLGGVWAVIRHFMKRRSKTAKRVEASDGGVAAGRDIRNSHVVTREDQKK
ncbi:MAG: hypothetical protein ACOYB4_03300 [Methyloceanibacter sp.]